MARNCNFFRVPFFLDKILLSLPKLSIPRSRTKNNNNAMWRGDKIYWPEGMQEAVYQPHLRPHLNQQESVPAASRGQTSSA
jgi:hypothetical protein